MITFKNQEFEHFDDWSSGRTFSDLEFVGCRFQRCGFSAVNMEGRAGDNLVALRSIARRVRFVNCQVEGIGYIGPGIVEESVVDGLKVKKHLQTLGTVFKHVVLKGRIEKILLSPVIDVFGQWPELQRSFDEANRDYYAEVDWALDISGAEFRDFDLRGMPARLVRRDPESQVVITREKAMLGKWRDIDFSGTHWRTAIELFLSSGEQDCVLVAPRLHRNFQSFREGLARLRDAGVAELY